MRGKKLFMETNVVMTLLHILSLFILYDINVIDEKKK